MRYYILHEKTPIPVDAATYAAWFEGNPWDRIILLTHAADGGDVSTMFLGIDANVTGEGPPIVFETMVFGGPHDREWARYASYDEAEAGHREIVARCGGMTPPAIV